MPQLDQFTYLTQFVWLCVFYMSFYILLFNDGLPKISRILKLRAHLVSQQSGDPRNLSARETAPGAPREESQDVPLRALNSSLSYLYSGVSGASNWCTGSVDSLNANQLKPMNKSYLRSLGEISLSQLIKNSALEASAPITTTASSLQAAMFLNTSQLWALRVQKSLLSNINKKKKKK